MDCRVDLKFVQAASSSRGPRLIPSNARASFLRIISRLSTLNMKKVYSIPVTTVWRDCSIRRPLNFRSYVSRTRSNLPSCKPSWTNYSYGLIRFLPIPGTSNAMAVSRLPWIPCYLRETEIGWGVSSCRRSVKNNQRRKTEYRRANRPIEFRKLPGAAT